MDTRGGGAWEEQHNTREVIDGALVVVFISMRVPCWAGKAGDSLRASVEYFDRGLMLTRYVHGFNVYVMCILGENGGQRGGWHIPLRVSALL